MSVMLNTKVKVMEAKPGDPLCLPIPEILICSCYNFINISKITKLKVVAHTCPLSYSGGRNRRISVLGVQSLPGQYSKIPISETKMKVDHGGGLKENSSQSRWHY